MTAFLAALFFVVIAEMGDKTQLLAMAFATRYRTLQVLTGVLIATLLNHALAVAAGNYLSALVPFAYIQAAAALSFIGFGFWTLRGDTLDDNNRGKTRFGPVVTVSIAFFIAELGDKTQLATIALAAKYGHPVMTWLGSTSGMLVSDTLGILVGVVLGKKIPEATVKLIAASIFIVFGLVTLYGVVPRQWLTPPAMVGFLGLILLLSYYYKTR